MRDMSDLPSSLGVREQAILEDLQCVRDELTLLKQDRSTYIKSSDIISLFNRTIKQAQFFNNVWPERPGEDNQVERMLHCCFQLLSLFFMSIGRNNDVPAVYALTSIIKRFLDHLTDADLYSKKDLVHISGTLEILQEVIKKNHGSYSQRLINLVSIRISDCLISLKNLQNHYDQLHGSLHPIYEKLVTISRLTSCANTRKNFSILEIQKFVNQLDKIDKLRVAGKFVATNGEVLMGSNVIQKLLHDCLAWSRVTLKRKGEIPERFKSTYQKLLDILEKLERLTFTQAWSLREADLYDYQSELDTIDESRIDRKFVDEDGIPAEFYIQRIFLDLMRRGYSYIYYLMAASKPISEGLLPVYNQLQTLKRCLIRIKNSGGVSSSRELYPYCMKLHFIESMRTDGKFHVENDVPEGQAHVNGLLEQCYELIYQLRETIENKSLNSHPIHLSCGDIIGQRLYSH